MICGKMMKSLSAIGAGIVISTAPGVAQSVASSAPPSDSLRASGDTIATAVLAGGCFWGVEAVYEHVRGVYDAVSGYAGGDAGSATYDAVSSGRTRHAESVRVTYDPRVVSYTTLLRVFFSVVHDPTQLNRQGPDRGPQYRSAIFYTDSTQAKLANAMVAELTKRSVFSRPIVTQVVPLEQFYPAEAYHQNFAARNPTHRYIVIHDAPKVQALKTGMPELYRETGK